MRSKESRWNFKLVEWKSIVYVHFSFFFNDTATTEIYTFSLHDALPICSLETSRSSSEMSHSSCETAATPLEMLQRL